MRAVVHFTLGLLALPLALVLVPLLFFQDAADRERRGRGIERRRR